MIFYHRKKEPFKGNVLLPLSTLREQFPELAAKEIAKYADRPFLLEKRIEPLDCTWADVLHLTAVHPSKMKEALLNAGYTNVPTLEYFEIQSEWLDQARIAYHISDFTYSQPAYKEMPASFEKESQEIPEAAVAYYKEEFAAGRFPLVWAHTWHVAYRGSIDVANAPVIVV